MFRPEDFAELTTPAAPNRKGNIFFVARPPLLCEEGNAPLLQFRACRAASPGSSTAPGLAAQHLPEAARLPDLLCSISRKQHGSRTCCAASPGSSTAPGLAAQLHIDSYMDQGSWRLGSICREENRNA